MDRGAIVRRLLGGVHKDVRRAAEIGDSNEIEHLLTRNDDGGGGVRGIACSRAV